MIDERFVARRFVNLFLIMIIMLSFSSILCLKNQILLDSTICILIVTFSFYLIFLYCFEHERLQKRISNNKNTNFRRVFTGFLICALIAVFCSFLPEFTRPVFFIPVIMYAFSDLKIATGSGIFFTSILCLTENTTNYEMILFGLMLLAGIILADSFDRKEKRIYFYLIILCFYLLLPNLIYYLYNMEYKIEILLWNVAFGLLTVVFLHFVYSRLLNARDAEVNFVMQDLLDEQYSLVQELAKFSKKEYEHAKRISRIAGVCAKLIGADEMVCQVAAFYYRIGILDGEDMVKSGTAIASSHCFPEAVIKIISEYNGLENKPSTIESAIVQMVNGLIKKLEVFDKNTIASNWNQDMVIYQTLNEYSAQGMYDQSGLSMNMFLKIREYLVNEEALV